MAPLVQWLIQVRRLVLVAQGVLLAVAASTGEDVRAPLAAGVAYGGAELARALLAPRSGSAVVHGGADLLALAVLIGAWGEAHQPLTVFVLVQVALFATFAAPREAWGFTGAAVVAQGLSLAVPVVIGTAVHDEGAAHLLAHAATYSLGAVALAHVLSGVAAASRAESRALLQRTEERDRAAQLAAIGTLAAGVAHELATPLGSVELLAEEVAADPALLPTLRAQIARCRGILDRMLARAEAPDGRTDDLGAHVARWLEEWRRASPGVELALEVAATGAARGAPDGWRAALWTVLDNARRAGPPIAVRVGSGPLGLRIVVEDAGPGVDPQVAARIGEPFVSQWGGAGLGLYVARTFARAAGGDISLSGRAQGTRAILDLAREET